MKIRLRNTSHFRENLAPCLLVAIGLATCHSYLQAQAQDSLETTLTTVRGSINQGHFKDAETRLRSVLNQSPKSADAHFLLGLVLFREQRPSESLAEYTLGAQLRAPGAEDLIGVASDYIFMKDYDDADRWLTKATELAPGLARGWYLLGRTQYNENRISKAEQSFLTCLRIDGHDVRAEYNLGLVYEKTEQPDKAIEAYKQAIRWQEDAKTKDPQPYLDLGMLLRHQGHVEEALPYLIEAEKSGPRNPMVHAELGLCYEHLNRLDDAVAELKKALILSPHAEALHFFLGRVYRRAGRAEDSTREFAEAAKLSGSKSNDGIQNEDVNP